MTPLAKLLEAALFAAPRPIAVEALAALDALDELRTARLVVVGVGGLILVTVQAPAWALFALVALGMVTMGALTAAFVYFTPWGPRPLSKA